MTNGKGSRDRVSDRARFGRNWDYYERRVKAKARRSALATTTGWRDIFGNNGT